MHPFLFGKMAIVITAQNGILAVICAVCVVLVSISVDSVIKSLDEMLVPCQHGTSYSNGRCNCVGTPFTGTFCGECDCANGFCTEGGTTPRVTSDYGCRCPHGSKFFGYLCDKCFAVEEEFCTGECKEGYVGARCDRKCFPNVSYAETLGDMVTADQYACHELRTNGGTCSPCSGHGTCMDGYCVCDDNWFDDGPSKCSKTCSPGPSGKICSGNGVCQLYGETAACVCAKGWRGDDCSVQCPGISSTGKSCSGNGVCSVSYTKDQPPTASCSCTGKFTGEACDIECPGTVDICSGHGTCQVENKTASCLCDTGLIEWTGAGCNCSDLITCNGRGACSNGTCACNDNFAGKNCLQCKPNYYGTSCQFFCEKDNVSNETHHGCNGRGTCTVLDAGTPAESIGCACQSDEVRKRIGRTVQSFYSTFDSDLDCADCPSGFFPKTSVFDAYDTTAVGLYVPCQIQCSRATCNDLGECNDAYGQPGESLCKCDASSGKKLNGSSYCTKCEDNWFPNNVKQAGSCANFCVRDIADVGGQYPAECASGEIDCVDCNGRGECNEEGKCMCDEGFTGDTCNMQCTSQVNGITCGGHGVCETSALQRLLQYEFQYVDDSGPTSTCVCDPQDIYSTEARDEAIQNNRSLDENRKSYYGETCDYHCERPPWANSEECNGMGNCTVYSILNPNDQPFACRQDLDCQTTAVRQQISIDPRWNDAKGPFCRKATQACFGDTYTIDDCYEIARLQRPPRSRSKECMNQAGCRAVLNVFDWHQWCTDKENTQSLLGAYCGDLSHMCPARTIPSQCLSYAQMSTTGDIGDHMDYCYEQDK